MQGAHRTASSQLVLQHETQHLPPVFERLNFAVMMVIALSFNNSLSVQSCCLN